jgi:RNA recognition motif-containing protein
VVFEKIPEIQWVKIITDFGPGRSKGLGIAEMTLDEDTNKTICALNGTRLMDGDVVVNETISQTFMLEEVA